MTRKQHGIRGLLGVLATSALLTACGTETATAPAAEEPYVPPEASDTPTVDADEQLIPDGPLFLPLKLWRPAPTDPQQLNPCLREDFTVLGASTTRLRSFDATEGTAQGQDFVAVFHSPDAAQQATYLLRRWQETCEERGADGLTANPPRTAPGGQGSSAMWFTTVEGKPSPRTPAVLSTTGLVTAGRTIAVVTVQKETTGDLTASEEMIERMVRRAQSRLE